MDRNRSLGNPGTVGRYVPGDTLRAEFLALPYTVHKMDVSLEKSGINGIERYIELRAPYVPPSRVSAHCIKSCRASFPTGRSRVGV